MVEPQLVDGLAANASAHYFQHNLLSRNIDAEGYEILNESALWINQFIWLIGHLVNLGIDIIQTSFDELIVVGEGVGQTHLSEAVDRISGKLSVSKTIFHQEIVSDCGFLVCMWHNYLIEPYKLGVMLNSAHNEFFKLWLVPVMANVWKFEPKLHEGDIVDIPASVNPYLQNIIPYLLWDHA